MTVLYNINITKDQLMKRIGDISQVAGAKEYQLTSGQGSGVRAIDVRNGSGLEFTIVPDRGMDIAWCRFEGMPVSFISKVGVNSAGYYEETDKGFIRGFYGGLLTTCGYTHMGKVCEDEGEKLGLHGYANHIRAHDVSVYQEWEGDEFVIKVRGKVVEAKVFGANIVLTRVISTRLCDNRIIIEDSIESCGFDAQPFMLLYHHNLGYPIVSENTVLYTSEGDVLPQSEHATDDIQRYKEFQAPTNGYKAQVFCHKLQPDANGDVFACLFNNKLGVSGKGSYIKFNNSTLPYLMEWKQMREGDYAVGLEPATWLTEGRNVARERGELDFIQAGEIKKFKLEIGIILNEEHLKRIRKV